MPDTDKPEVVTSPFPLWDQPIVRDLDYRTTKEFAAEVLRAATHWFVGDANLQVTLAALRKDARRRGIWSPQAEWIIGYGFAEYGVHYGDIRPND